MKTRTWIILFAVLLIACLGLSIPLLLPSDDASHAEILVDGQLVRTVPLSVDQQFTLSTHNGGSNTITVQNGAIAVTEADCPDHYCMHRGFCSGGTQIVCLPNRLVIRFTGAQEVDAVS